MPSTKSRRSERTAHKPLEPFSVDHFRQYADLMVFDDGERRGVDDFQLELVEDLFAGYRRDLWIIPEGNGKSTLVSLIALYGADYSISPWIPIGAAAAKQARIIHDQAGGFVQRTPGMSDRFRVYGGYLRIESKRNGGIGIEVFAHDPKTGDGVIPYPYALLDELHRHPDMRLWELWAGKLRKRDAQIIGISTAGEPETPFENMRDAIRLRATDRKRTGAHLRAASEGEILHEWMVAKDDDCSDMAAVKAANPLSTITEETLGQDFALITNLGDWKRLKCNRPTRAIETAITDKEWDDAEVDDEIPANAEIVIGMDVAWKWDTTGIVALWKGPKYRLLGATRILVPPRDGSSIHPDEIKSALYELADGFRVDAVVMDMHRAEDIAAWIEDEMGVTVIDHDHRAVKTHVADFEAFMDGLRNGTVKHNGDRGLKAHALNAIARRLPGGDYRFDRPNASRGSAREQDRRVIDALTAAAIAVEHSTRDFVTTSVYESRGVLTA
jgi:phage terminase large subunit-like protein